MNFYYINKKNFFIIIIYFFLTSCVSFNEKKEITFEEIEIDNENYIKDGNYKNFDIIDNFWSSNNHNNNNFEYIVNKNLSFNFGKGKTNLKSFESPNLK